ncbi:MAG TPA: glutamate--cysteine ligase [Casimicrobiaceae bacterium]|nr:glutamate--cysteine ligase [Casimicrobiaceae bacterium]
MSSTAGSSVSLLEERARALPRDVLARLKRGIEKESLRVRPDGSLATTPHPAALGSALTHPNVTTDFSESQLELITGVNTSAEACIAELTAIHQAVYRALGDELLWCASMPCRLPDEAAIPIGRYGSSNVGRAKSVYRTGLTHRYGKRMQMISGIHYNFSMPDRRSNDEYFGLIRNFRRNSWLLLYLFGASPAVCASFVAGRRHELQPLSDDTLFLPYATSLRMGRLGYQSDAQSSLAVSYNCLESYAASLQEAMTRPYAPYEAIGIRSGDDYHQLGTSLLQIENEFYGTIRPKRVIRPGERPLHALRERGVEYVEVRLMDLDPFEPVAIKESTCRMLDVFLIHCLLRDSPPDTPEELAAIIGNKQRVAARGREPGLRLVCGRDEISLVEWGERVLAECEPIAAALDAAKGTQAHRDALALARARLADPASTPSARVLQAIEREHGKSYVHFVLAQSRRHRDTICALPLSDGIAERFARLAEESRREQREIEAADTVPFEIYRQGYLDPARLSV